MSSSRVTAYKSRGHAFISDGRGSFTSLSSWRDDGDVALRISRYHESQAKT